MTPRPGRLVLLGHPVQHSISPRFQNAALQHLGIPLVYEAMDVPPAALDRTVSELHHAGAAGNVTVPHKVAFAARCDRRTPLADRARAVNTFWVADDGALVGDNTDVAGFDALARRALGSIPAGCRVALLGAGGAAAAVLAAIEQWDGAAVVLYNRTRERAERLASRFPVVARVVDAPHEAVHGAAITVNATSIGLSGDALPIPVDALDPGCTVLDLVYRRGGTPWVRAACARGLPALDGLAMLLEQGALAFERWFDVDAPRSIMRDAVQ